MNNSQPPESNPDTEIGERIKNALIIKNVSALALSDKSGISYPTLRRSLNGGRSLTFREFGNIAAALNLSPADLLPQTLTGAAA